MQIHAILPIYWSMEIIQPWNGMRNSTHNQNISHNIKISVVNEDRIFGSNIYCTKCFFCMYALHWELYWPATYVTIFKL